MFGLVFHSVRNYQTYLQNFSFASSLSPVCLCSLVIAYVLCAKIVFCQILNVCTAQIYKNLLFAPYEHCQ